eukprot:TRINITY_DN531_c0_g3_i1.p1 TRINITY_DN531_c0_g3~~TRINITY_DN531_c0_g3_i1.p1  ORF type:complete len:316 (-),score=100.65 TRINITY_DN531_c0_g3_i1:36-926(-)
MYACSAIALLAALASVQGFVAPTASKRLPLASQGFGQACKAIPARASQVTMSDPDTPLVKRFGSLKGRDVKPVSESMMSFCKCYPKPILPQYRTLVNDLIQSTHLSVVDARFTYDAVFATGLHGIFFKLMRSYPGEGEEKVIFDCLMNCIDLDPAQVTADAEGLISWAKSASEADLEAAMKGEGSSALAAVANAAKDDEFYLYSKNWGLGLILIMEAAGVETSEEKMEHFVALLGFPAGKAKQDLLQYKEVLEKTAQAEQLFKEIEIREKKKMADRLEEKARRALEEAAKVESAIN